MRKLLFISAMLTTMALATACSSTSKSSTTAPATENVSVESNASTTEVETSVSNSISADEQEITGTVSELKNVAFNLTDNLGNTYGFTFDGDAPKGFDTIKNGDKVTVVFKGELSEIDPITDIISIEVVK